MFDWIDFTPQRFLRPAVLTGLDVQLSGNIGRRHDNTKGLLFLINLSSKATALHPPVVRIGLKLFITKNDVGRDGFLERAWDWANTYGNRISDQLKKLGCSCDWSREAFTMDEHCSKAVIEVFVKLYNKGLIYKGDRVILTAPLPKSFST